MWLLPAVYSINISTLEIYRQIVHPWMYFLPHYHSYYENILKMSANGPNSEQNETILMNGLARCLSD